MKALVAIPTALTWLDIPNAVRVNLVGRNLFVTEEEPLVPLERPNRMVNRVKVEILSVIEDHAQLHYARLTEWKLAGLNLGKLKKILANCTAKASVNLRLVAQHQTSELRISHPPF